jgi:hypothetical protein
MLSIRFCELDHEDYPEHSVPRRLLALLSNMEPAA